MVACCQKCPKAGPAVVLGEVCFCAYIKAGPNTNTDLQIRCIPPYKCMVVNNNAFILAALLLNGWIYSGGGI